MEGLSVNGLAAILGALNEVKNGRFALNKDLRIVRQALGFLKDIYGDKVLSHGIRRCIKVNEAQTELTDLFSFSPYCTAANDYSLVIKELFNL